MMWLFNLAEFKVEQTLQEVSIEDQSPRHLIKVTVIKFFLRCVLQIYG